MALWVNTLTKEVKWLPYSHEEGLPVGGPDDAEGTPLWQPYRCKHERLTMDGICRACGEDCRAGGSSI